jgi:hypothetical protein
VRSAERREWLLVVFGSSIVAMETAFDDVIDDVRNGPCRRDGGTGARVGPDGKTGERGLGVRVGVVKGGCPHGASPLQDDDFDADWGEASADVVANAPPSPAAASPAAKSARTLPTLPMHSTAAPEVPAVPDWDSVHSTSNVGNDEHTVGFAEAWAWFVQAPRATLPAEVCLIVCLDLYRCTMWSCHVS